MADQQQRGQARKKNALDEWKLRLTGDPQQGATKKPHLSFSVVKNQVHVVVRTNVPNDKDYGRIVAKMDSPTFFTFLVALEDAFNGVGPLAEGVRQENKNHKFVNGQRSKEALVESWCLVGKEDDGRYYLSVLDYNKERPRIKFYFLPTDYHSLARRDGQPLTVGELSHMYIRGWSKLLHALTPIILANEYVEPPPIEDRNGGGGGNYNRGGNNGGGNYNRGNQGGSRSDSSGGNDGFSDDDFPM